MTARDLAPLLAAVEEEPWDIAHRLILADAYEELGMGGESRWMHLDIDIHLMRERTGMIDPFLFNRWRNTPAQNRPPVVSLTSQRQTV